jgi:hypothetical protein
MRAVGAFSSFRVPSSGFLVFGRSGDEEEGTIEADRLVLVPLKRIGTKALRTSSGAESLPLSLGLLGGVREGLLARSSAVEGVGGVVECMEELL